jgi:hypothetical protein
MLLDLLLIFQELQFSFQIEVLVSDFFFKLKLFMINN